ncbi:MAG: pilus assembly protein [Chloroflexota bacterium]|nr:pilus assembly protein [Chloroflexota bacterium]
MPDDGVLVMRRFGRDGAQALVEFALVLPVLLMLIVGLFDVGRAVQEENTLAYAAREGTRYAIVHGSSSASPIPYCSSCTNAGLTQVVDNAAVGVSGTISVTISYPDGDNKRGSRVKVQASVPFVPLPSQFLFNGGLSVTLRGGSELVIEY